MTRHILKRVNCMRLCIAAVTALGLSLAAACSNDEGVDNREQEYGYVQFRLYKAASYTPQQTDGGQSATETAAATRAIVPQLEYLGQASKIRVTMTYNGNSIVQTLTLSSADAEESSEWGLRSTRLQLLAGRYTVDMYSLYDSEDEELYRGRAIEGAESFEVVPGGLTAHDLTASVVARGKVRFRFTKDMSDFTHTPKTRADNEYTFDEINYIDVSVLNTDINTEFEFTNLPVKFSMHFDEDDDKEDGYQTSTLQCDTLLPLLAGRYRVVSYTPRSSRKTPLRNGRELVAPTGDKAVTFTIEDNVTKDYDVPVKIYETDDYIQDYYALYRIWEALDGPNWHYQGNDYAEGLNWDFNRDPDLWGAQPGVSLHSNGRVGGLDLSTFGFKGAMPAAIGMLTELETLYLGTHNDTRILEIDPTVSLNGSRKTVRERHMEYARMVHVPTQMSEPIARALKENGRQIPEISLYDNYSEADIIDKATGGQKRINLYDTQYGVIYNGLTSLPEEIGNLKKLETLFIANSTISKLPDAMKELESLTDFELYNCPNMKEFPTVLGELPELVSANISNNRQWSAEEIKHGLAALADGPSREKIQILYMRQNSLEELPDNICNLKKIGLLDLAYNRLRGELRPLTRDVSPVQLYLDNNEITGFGRDENGYFCEFADIETFSATHNLLTEIPDIFDRRSKFTMSTVDLSYNQIDKIENAGSGYKGLNVETLTLANNRLEVLPAELFSARSSIGYLDLRANRISRIPQDSFKTEEAKWLSALDLSYNLLTTLRDEEYREATGEDGGRIISAETLPYLYGIDLSYNRFAEFPWDPLNVSYLTTFAIRGQRDANGGRCLREWPTGIYNHKGLRGFYIGSNDLRTINDTISFLIYYLDISDNPNIVFDASDICYYYQVGAYILIYDKTQKILNCDIMVD